ncbi:serine--tRNA ligase [Candidatus Sumerlaeota bacterium]|nr:serine--tRNA ligase [Candidatus Sumerlaeota bacterium]
MLDLRFIRENPDAVRRACEVKRHAADIDQLLELDQAWRDATSRADQIRALVKSASKEIGGLMKAGKRDEAEAKKAEVAAAKSQLEEIERTEGETRAEIDDLLLRIPNLPHADVKAGPEETCNEEVHRWGEPRTFDFKPRDHVEIAESLGLIDFKRAAKLAGSGFACFTGLGAKLERALIGWMIDMHVERHGYREVSTPFIVTSEVMVGTGQLPKFAEDMYHVPKEDFWLIPTAEVPVTNLHRGEILSADDLPIKYVAHTPCFRSEAGSYGKDVRGLSRVHQFDKVEMVNFTTPETSWDQLETLRREAEEVLEALGLHYRTLRLSTEGMTFASAMTYDLEVWAPGAKRFYEVSSASCYADFQARRAGIRFRRTSESKPEFVHTLNASGLALPRLVIALLETYQRGDGTVEVPEPLRHRLGADALRPE